MDRLMDLARRIAGEKPMGYVVINQAEGNAHVGDKTYDKAEDARTEADRLNKKKNTSQYKVKPIT